MPRDTPIPAHDPLRPQTALGVCLACAARGPHLDGSLQLGPLVAEPQHPGDGQGHTEPVEEAEEVDDGEDITGEGIQQGHDALQAERRASVRTCRAPLEPGAGWPQTAEASSTLGHLLGGLAARVYSYFEGRSSLGNT